MKKFMEFEELNCNTWQLEIVVIVLPAPCLVPVNYSTLGLFLMAMLHVQIRFRLKFLNRIHNDSLSNRSTKISSKMPV